MPLRAPQRFTLRVCRFSFWHQQPSEKDCTQCDAGNAEKTYRATEISNYQAKERGTKRRSNAREHSDKALGQIEPAGSVCEISNNQSGKHAQDATAHAVE